MTTSHTSCPICGEGNLTSCLGKNTVEYKGKSTELEMQYSVCDSCGSEQSNPAQLRSNKRAMTAFKKQVDGLLTGAEVRRVREQLGINQAEAYRIFGGGPVAFSKYESDDVVQSESMDNLLRVAVTLPAAFVSLKQKDWSVVETNWTWTNIDCPRDTPRHTIRVISETKPMSEKVWGKTG